MSTSTPATCSPHESHTCHSAGKAWLIDVRTPAEYRALHAEGATLMPLDAFDPKAVAASIPASSTIQLLCKSGGRATQAAQKLAGIGCPCVVVRVAPMPGPPLAYQWYVARPSCRLIVRCASPQDC